MLDWKIIIAVFLAIISLTTGLIESVFSGGIVERVKEVTKKVVGERNLPDLFSMPVDRNITVRGDFKSDNYSLVLDDISIENISMSFESQDSQINIGSQKIDTSKIEKSHLLVNDFNGKIEINADKSIAKLNGKAGETSVNEISLKSDKKTSIKTDYIKYEDLHIRDLESKELMLRNLKGKLTIKDKIIIKIDKEPIKLNSYQGDLRFNDSTVEFSGVSSRIMLNGKDIRSTISS